MSSLAGVVSVPTWKYGGPCVFDLNNDGHYDFVLGNHDQTPIQLFISNGDGTFNEILDVMWRDDVHGITAADYDLDGDNDLLVAVGGGNGTAPKPPRLIRNDNGTFKDVTVEAGISKMGARGRSVRWIDLDLDGDLDMMQLNAAKMVTEDVPRNLLFENLGDGSFRYRSTPVFESIKADKVLITDFDGDRIDDLVTFSSNDPVTFWKGDGNFGFVNVNDEWLPEELRGIRDTRAIAEADIDNDGDLDFYLSRGGNTSHNCVSHDGDLRRVDLRNRGNKGRSGVSFTTAPGNTGVTLRDFYHFPRGKKRDIPLFIGEDMLKEPAPTKVRWIGTKHAEGFPKETKETGWYIGYLGDGNWRLEWNLNDDVAWYINSSIVGITGYKADYEEFEPEVPDVLLRNDGGKFSDASSGLPAEAYSTNTGVVPGDFDNDGDTDFFVHRFGELRKRILDVLMLNQGGGTFVSWTAHGATDLSELAHGDMGAAFDYDLDGFLDLLNGDDDDGSWHLYRNEHGDSEIGRKNGNYMLIRVGYSAKGTDPVGAEVLLKSGGVTQIKRVGSGSSAFSQNQLNTLHFGLGKAKTVSEVRIRWRDGTERVISKSKANKIIMVGTPNGSNSN